MKKVIMVALLSVVLASGAEKSAELKALERIEAKIEMAELEAQMHRQNVEFEMGQAQFQRDMADFDAFKERTKTQRESYDRR